MGQPVVAVRSLLGLVAALFILNGGTLTTRATDRTRSAPRVSYLPFRAASNFCHSVFTFSMKDACGAFVHASTIIGVTRSVPSMSITSASGLPALEYAVAA